MNTPKKNPKGKSLKELPWAMLTAAGFTKPLQYLLILSAVAGGTIGSSKLILEDQKQERERVRVLLQPPTKDSSDKSVSESTSVPLNTSLPQKQDSTEETPLDQEPINTPPEAVEQQNLQQLMMELEEAYREGAGIYDLIKKAKEQLSRNEIKTFMERIVEMTDANYPFPTEGMTEKEIDNFYKNELRNELRLRDRILERFAQSMTTELVLDDPIILGFLLSALEEKEREERAKSTSTDIQVYHRLRSRMIGTLCARLERETSDFRLPRPKPQQIIDECRSYIEYLRKLGFDKERIKRYKQRLQNVS